ncbi:hypothetical protein [Enterococcus sp. LJL90]
MEVREIQVIDQNFIWPLVDGYGREIQKLELNQEYRLIRKPNYMLLLRPKEQQLMLPFFAPSSLFQQQKVEKLDDTKRRKSLQARPFIGYVTSR